MLLLTSWSNTMISTILYNVIPLNNLWKSMAELQVWRELQVTGLNLWFRRFVSDESYFRKGSIYSRPVIVRKGDL